MKVLFPFLLLILISCGGNDNADLESNRYYSEYKKIYSEYQKVDLEQTKTDLINYVDEFPDVDLGWLFLAKVYFDVSEFDKSKNAYKIALSINDHQPDALLGLAAIGRKEKRYPESISFYNQALKIDSSNSFALNGIAISYFLSGKPDSALFFSNKAMSIDSSINEYKINYSFISTWFLNTVDSISKTTIQQHFESL